MWSVTAAFSGPVGRGSGWLCLLLVCSLLLLNGCAWLDAKQRQIIYRPTAGTQADFSGLRAGDERYFLNLPPSVTPRENAQSMPETQRIDVWWLPHPNKTAPTLLYLHGTFRTLFENLHKIEALRSAGFSVLAVDYRGWGLSTPLIPSESSILQDADLAWTEMQRREPRAAQRVIYGHSMGSGVAVDLASRLQAPNEYGALILESAFTSFSDVAREAGWVTQFLDLFNNERFASLEKISRVHAPLLMIHGTLDTTVPLRLGQQLFAAANPPKRWLTIEGGAHSDLNRVGQVPYQTALGFFLRDYLSAK
jgi:alpha-beta hydrolase superfamily lysophospholipase